MKRLHVHISVDNLNESIRFYSAMFNHQPTVQKEDYAKWMLDDPRVNFAISNKSSQFGLNHLGIQAENAEELHEMGTRLQQLQTDIEEESNASCCYAKSDKYWVTDPQGIAWETFHTLDSIPVFGEKKQVEQGKGNCCVPSLTPANSNDKQILQNGTQCAPGASKCC
ncbi:MAG: glyoxalase/bleomycin resistance/dioxygenase family protein [Burkholderiales bacterium]|nr:glyoxalase/bleomycin resistance/dioxygenase family protein [Burkholderiales bacterium]